MGEIISVIVPVYKVESYLDQCVESILAQTYTDLEVILVDDGSPDQCPALCDAWAKKDNRVKVIHKKNGGLSDARNAGMKIATGTYIGFIDSDDWIAPEMYQLLYDEMRKTDSDISACGVQMVWEDGNTRMLTCNGNIVLDNKQAMEALIEENWLKQPVWYKLYKRSVVEGIPFAVGKCHEDVFWSYQPLAKAKKVCVIDTPCYFYRQRSDSIMGEEFSAKRLDGLEAMEQRILFLKKEYPWLVGKAQERAYFFAMYLMQVALREKRYEILSCIQKKAECVCPSNKKQLHFSQRMWIFLSKVSFLSACKLRNLFKIGI